MSATVAGSRAEWPLRCLYATATRYARSLAKRCRRICADGNRPSADYRFVLEKYIDTIELKNKIKIF